MYNLRHNAAITVITMATAVAVIIALTVSAPAGQGQTMAQNNDWGPKWTAEGELTLPTDYHQWVFLGSPLTPHALNGGAAPFPEYHNVYVHQTAFRAYRATGEWPEGTILLKELQLTTPATNPDGSSIEVSGRGYFPSARNGIDISVKDSRRFKESNGWGFFNFGHHAPPYAETAAAQPVEACAGCHIANADEMVFTKFYRPILDAK
ncbi:cytochrome P460 family protein [Lentisalinibacter salinarum]|uniref:cytochrome P460 family protein n=1 Tax=Lentisalinibacter salinarum TaxID=2992239 RepID=UPI003870D24C